MTAWSRSNFGPGRRMLYSREAGTNRGELTPPSPTISAAGGALGTAPRSTSWAPANGKTTESGIVGRYSSSERHAG